MERHGDGGGRGACSSGHSGPETGGGAAETGPPVGDGAAHGGLDGAALGGGHRRRDDGGLGVKKRGETGEAPPGADEASLFRGWPPNSGYAVSAVWLGPTVEGEAPPGEICATVG